MGRHVLAVAVVAADTALMMAAHPGGRPVLVAMYTLTVALIVTVRYRAPLLAFVAALVFATLAGGAYVLLLWAAYQAGQALLSRTRLAVATGAAVGALAVQVTSAHRQLIVNLVCTYLVFVALPLLAGRYLAQHRRLVDALDRRNQQLRGQRHLVAEQEQLRERLRIARDMHDGIGHQLSLVSIQAAALEVSQLPPPQRIAVANLARATRAAMTGLYDMVGTLREPIPPRPPGIDAVDGTIAEFQAAGAAVTMRYRGEPQAVSDAAGQSAYRVIEEGLTNAARHAPGQPVTVSVEWEAGALLLSIDNELPARPSTSVGSRSGLSGLDERVRAAGGFLDHGPREGRYRLFAVLPIAAAPASAPPESPGVVGIRTAALGFATAAMMFLILPASMLLGVG